MKEVVIVSGTRTPIGSFGGSLKNVSAIDLGSLVIQDSLRKVNLRPHADEQALANGPDTLKDAEKTELEKRYANWDETNTPVQIDEVIMGNVLQSGLGQNPARQSTIRAGLNFETPAFTMNKVCGSGLKAIALAASSIMTGESEIVIAGGQESMSNTPMALSKARWGHRMELTGVGDIHDLMVFDGLYEIFYGYHMGVTAENIAKMYDISRQDQDQLAVLSHKRARIAIEQGIFAEEISTVTIPHRKGEITVDTDERPMETSLEKMAKLRPAFDREGTVTAGNASGINDGAAAVVLMSREKAEQLDLAPLAKISSWASGGLDPAYMGLGPVPSIRKILELKKMSISDIEMIELNEAFASQAIGCMRELGIDPEKPNQLGSGISLGHPIGCTGARQMVTAIHQMQRHDYANGLISMCIGGGMGMAMLIEKI